MTNVAKKFCNIHSYIGVQFMAEFKSQKSNFLKAHTGTVQRDFRLPFFSSFKPAWATDQRVKIFSIFVKISLSYSNWSVKKTDYPQCHTGGSKNKIVL